MLNIAKKPDSYFPIGALLVNYKKKEPAFFIKERQLISNYNLSAVDIQSTPLANWYNRILKRLFDIILSIVVIVMVLSWLIPIIGLIKFISGEKGLFFIQNRNGYKDYPFSIIKFRTMKKNGFSDTKPATRDDARITKIGRFLRRTSIDELPQFFNVLIGNMSVIGPRPHMNQHDKEFKAIVKKYMFRHTVKPGISGYAQVNGHRGEIRGLKDMKQRIEFDVTYIENWSVWFDIKIVILTIVKLLKGDSSAY